VRTLLLLWLFATCTTSGFCLDAADAWIGPWLLQRNDGIRQIGLSCPGGAATQTVSLVRAATNEVVQVHAAWHELPQAKAAARDILDLRLPERECRPGAYRLTVGPQHFDLLIPEGPSDERPTRVAVVGRLNYPSRAELDRLADALHGPIQLVACLAGGLGDVLGSGGWEGTIPLLVLGAGRAPVRDERPDSLADLVGDAVGQWPLGAHWGCLGLPCADVEDAGHAIAEDLSLWQVYIEPHASWNPSLRARSEPSPMLAVPLLSLCQHMHVPVILAGDDGAGFVSEPLTVDHGQMIIAPGGTRYVGATPVGEGLSGLTPQIALPVDQAALIGLVADAHTLDVVICAQGGTELMRLSYAHGDDPATPVGPGWGQGNGEELKKQWLDGGDHAEQALADLGWLSALVLAAMHVGEQDMDTLLAGAEKDPHAMRLLRRFTGIQAIANGSLLHRVDTIPAPLLRDLVLRRLGQEQDIDFDMLPAAAASPDQILVRAVLRAYERHPSVDLSRLLMRRIALQANGSLPLETDAFIEHRLLTAVFDSTTTSPTPLRPLATALRPRLDVLCRGPIDRFIARHGETRAP
jgi:hypothetical protein